MTLKYFHILFPTKINFLLYLAVILYIWYGMVWYGTLYLTTLTSTVKTDFQEGRGKK